MLPEKEMTFNKNEGGDNGKKILRAVGAVIVVTVVVTGIFLWQESSEPESNHVSETIPDFIPPVYEMEESPEVLTHPLFLPIGAKGSVEITPEGERLKNPCSCCCRRTAERPRERRTTSKHFNFKKTANWYACHSRPNST